MTRRELYETLRAKGLSYREIGLQCGVSHQAVEQALSGRERQSAARDRYLRRLKRSRRKAA